MAKSRERLLARGLRSEGASIREIAQKIGVSISSVSLWCCDIELTRIQKEELKRKNIVGGMVGRMKAWKQKVEERQERLKHFGMVGALRVAELSERDLYLTGLALYWAEGSKKHRRVIFVNSDPAMIRLFLRWVKVCFNIQRSQIVCRLQINQLYANNEIDLRRYWSLVTQIPLSQFTKTSLVKTLLKKFYETNDDYHGVLTVTVRKSTNLCYTILGGIDHLRKQANQMIQYRLWQGSSAG